MQKIKPYLTAVILCLGIVSAPLSFAEDIAIASSSAQDAEAVAESQSFTDQSVEDMVAISRTAKQNEAINDAVLGNEAISDNLLQLGQAQDRDNIESPEDSVEVIARQSTSQSVDSDKLILNSPVVDQANIFSNQEKALLTQRLRNIYNQGLAQAAVVTVPTTNGMDIFDYSLQLAERWELGEADTDDGLLFVVAVNDRKMYILSGYGLEGVLPDAALNQIIDRQITPEFRSGDYAGGIIKGVDAVKARLQADPDVLARSDSIAQDRRQQIPQGSAQETPSVFGLFIISLVFGMFLTTLLGRILGSLVATGGFATLSLLSGGNLIMTLIMGVFLWIFLSARGSGGGKGGGKGGGRRGGGVVFFPGGGFGGGGFGGGGFGGGGFGGGGGGFGGGGAGGSW